MILQCKSYDIAFAQNCYTLCPEDSTNKNNACGHHFAMTTSVENNYSQTSTAVQMEHTCGSLVLHKSHPINLSYLLTLVSHELHSNFLLALNQL